MSLAFLLTTIVVVLTPGTGAVYTIAAGLARGRRAGVVAAFGCTLGVVPHMVAAITGLAALLHASAVAFQAIKWLGVAYLLVLAWRTLRDTSAVQIDQETTPSPGFALYGVCAAAMRDRVISRPRVMTWLRRTFAGTYVLLAGRLAVEDQ